MNTRKIQVIPVNLQKLTRYAFRVFIGVYFTFTFLGQSSALADAKFIKEIPWAEQGQWIKVDTHIHSSFSDGRHSISEIAAKAFNNGCHVIAITDHSDRELKGASFEYEREVKIARRTFPNLIILSGVEWNIPPWGGDQHVSVLISPGPDEFDILREFKRQFDDHQRTEHDSELATQALEWLHQVATETESFPVLILNHPSRKLSDTNDVRKMFEQWREVNDLIVGFEGGPGHQKGEPNGSYKGSLKTIDRWDPVIARTGEAWDQLLGQGMDVWGAFATSDFHESGFDYWPGEFSETWLYVPERSAEGALAAIRHGSFFATHGHIVRNASLSIQAAGLDRPAYPGEVISVPEGELILVTLACDIPSTDWTGNRNYLDELTIVTIQNGESSSLTEERIYFENAKLERGIEVPPGGIVVRGLGRISNFGDGDLFFFTNPIRIEAAPAWSDGGASPFLDFALYFVVGLFAVVGILLLWRSKAIKKQRQKSHQKRGPPPVSKLHTQPLKEKSSQDVDWTPPEVSPVKQDSYPREGIVQNEKKEPSAKQQTQADTVIQATPLLWWESFQNPRYFRPGYTMLVLAVASVYAFLMVTQGSLLDVPGISETWRPTAFFIVPALASILVLIYVPRYPLIGILSFITINFVLPRNKPQDAYLFWIRLPETISALVLVGAALSQEFSSRYKSLIKSHLFLLVLGFIGWAILSSIIAELTTQVPAADHHFPLRLINILMMTSLAAITTWNLKHFAIFAGTCGVSLAFRSYYFPDYVHRDGDLGYLLAGVIPLVLSAIAVSEKWRFRICFTILSSLLLFTFYETESRTAAVGLISAACVAWFFSPHKLAVLVCSLPIILVSGFAFSSGGFASRIKSLFEEGIHSGSAGSRIEIWSTIPQLLEGHWLFGIGIGRFIGLVGTVDSSHSGHSVHNIFLGVLAETGIPGFALYSAIFIAAIILYFKKSYLSSGVRSFSAHSIGVISSLAGLVAAGQFVTRQDSPFQFCLIGIVIAWSQSLSDGETNSTQKPWDHGLRETLRRPDRADTTQNIHQIPMRPYLLVSFFAFLTFAIYGSLVPLDYTELSFEIATERFADVLKSPLNFDRRIDWSTNILLFIPLGFFLLGSLTVDQRKKRALFLAPIVILNCALISLFIEFSQLWFPTRTPSLNDIIAETIGGVIGAGLWLSVGQGIMRYCRTLLRTNTKEDRIVWLLGGYLFFLLVYSLVPFDLTLQPVELYQKYKDGLIEFIPFSFEYDSIAERLYSLLGQLLIFVPVGYFATKRDGKRNLGEISLKRVLMQGVLLVSAIEVAQITVLSRVTSSTDILVGSVGIFIGAMIALPLANQVFVIRSENRTGKNATNQFALLALLYTGWLFVLFWYPFDFTDDSNAIREQWKTFFSVPLAQYYRGNIFLSISSMTRKLLWFFPLGYFLFNLFSSMFNKKIIVGVSGFVVLVVAGSIVELGQMLQPQKVAIATNVVIYVIGGGLGWLLASFLQMKEIPLNSRSPF